MKTDLKFYEDKIDIKYFDEEYPIFKGTWFDTIDAIHTITKKKLYKKDFKTIDDYIKIRWKGISKRKFFYLRQAGRICNELKKEHDVFPNTQTLCVEIEKCAKKHHVSLSKVWSESLLIYGSVKNVNAKKISELKFNVDADNNDNDNADADNDNADADADIDNDNANTSVRSVRKGFTMDEILG